MRLVKTLIVSCPGYRTDDIDTMDEQQSVALDTHNAAIPWLVLAVATLTLLALVTGRALAILGLVPPDTDVKAGVWVFAWSLLLPALWPLIGRRHPNVARRILVIGSLTVLALALLALVATIAWVEWNPGQILIKPLDWSA
jgi:hypothetical protein